MTFPREPDSGLEELLRSALRGEADAVSPAGDGLGRIQQRVASRRSRRVWLRPVAVVGAAAVVGGAGFAAYALTSQPDENASVAIQPTHPVPSTLPATPPTSPSPTVTAAAPTFPASAFYPFTSAAAEQSWEAQRGPAAQPWVVDPVAEAKKFVADYVLADGVTTLIDRRVVAKTASVTLGRMLSDAGSQRPHAVTTVRMERFGKAWLVVGADDPGGMLEVSSPAGGERISSPVTVSGPGFGTEERVQVDVRAIGAPFLTAKDGQAQFGNGTPRWSTTVAFAAPADPRGAVVVQDPSAADGGPGRIAVVGVSFGTETTGYPAYFYGVKNDRITKFSARNGASVKYLTTPAPGGADSDPQLVGDRVYYLSGAGTCANGLRYVPVDGGPSQAGGGAGWQSAPGYVITGYAVPTDNVSELFEVACAAGTSPRAKLVLNSVVNDTQPTTETTDYQALPPGIVGDPTWEVDRAHIDVVMQMGSRTELQRLDAFNSPSPDHATPACSGYDANDGEPFATEVDAAGNAWFATRTGSSIQVLRCIGTTPRVMFSIAGNRQPADVDVAGSGTAVLVTDTDGDVWRWTQGGTVLQLSPRQPMKQLTW